MFQNYMKRAFFRAQKLYDIILEWLRKLHLKLVTIPQKLRKIWEDKIGIAPEVLVLL